MNYLIIYCFIVLLFYCFISWEFILIHCILIHAAEMNSKPFAKPPQSLPHALAQSAPPLQHNGALGAPRGALGALAKGFAQGLTKGLTKGLTEGLTNHKNQKITKKIQRLQYI